MNQLLTFITMPFVLFIPGYIITYIFFAKKSIDMIERGVLSFIFSVAIIPLVIFYVNMMGIRITLTTVLLQIVWVIILAIGIIVSKHLFLSKR